ncbi:MAG: glycine dehydrogenase (aminomethyl-transferring) [Myxococcales bacterium]|mgnify:CR=1 FL=1|nr:glycine dehydrogenase (aminomethyl-transferring) [Myxococcales bacterium]
MTESLQSLLNAADRFDHRHLGPRLSDVEPMLKTIGVSSIEDLINETIPAAIRLNAPLNLPDPMSETKVIEHMRALAAKNTVMRSLIGMGYYDCVTPPVVQRNVLENPGWYTQYTPYQAEISQGRLEALLNFQTMVADLTGLPMSNSSLLDEGTAAAEAMAMCRAITRGKRSVFFVDQSCHPQTIEIIQTRAEPLDITVEVGCIEEADFSNELYFGLLVQCPDTRGQIVDPTEHIARAKASGTLSVVATDLMALALMKSPGEMGADIAIGNSQRFGVPLGLGGPHAAFIATHDKHRRLMPGRIIGVSKDSDDRPAYRLALQTREQHIRRDRATSNICTAQVLLAIMASMYAVYHGPKGIRAIAQRITGLTSTLKTALASIGYESGQAAHFDTLCIRTDHAQACVERACDNGFNLRLIDSDHVGISLDERSTLEEVDAIVAALNTDGKDVDVAAAAANASIELSVGVSRTTDYLSHPVFNRYQAEHEMLRYINRLQAKDLSLTTSMIPLGSCTMKLNATTEMLPVTWPEFGQIHPFAPKSQWAGYRELFSNLEGWLAEITGFAGVSLQPNAGSQGEYAGLLVIRAYHQARGDQSRNVCLIPTSAHGTNPASAVMAGMKVVAVKCNERGDIDVADLEERAKQYADQLAALMVTYPSTHGVFEESIRHICSVIHDNGGMVYMDGANMNAQVGLCRPGDFGPDVCHLNLHKTFCIPHGGGGPGMGPIGVVDALVPFLPGHKAGQEGDAMATGAISAAPYGSPSILPISYSYIAMMGEDGLRKATEFAILNANYMAARLREHFDILYTGANGRVAHEFIIDCRHFKTTAGISVDDIAKRLMDYGFHAPTMSFPVAGTLMIEPTESESREELDRFCHALISIRGEIKTLESGEADQSDNPLVNAPHTAQALAVADWSKPYSRQQAAWPAPWLANHKYWPPVARVDNAFGDRNPICTCPSMDEFA